MINATYSRQLSTRTQATPAQSTYVFALSIPHIYHQYLLVGLFECLPHYLLFFCSSICQLRVYLHILQCRNGWLQQMAPHPLRLQRNKHVTLCSNGSSAARSHPPALACAPRRHYLVFLRRYL